MSNARTPNNGPSSVVAATLRDNRRAAAAVCNPPAIADLIAARNRR